MTYNTECLIYTIHSRDSLFLSRMSQLAAPTAEPLKQIIVSKFEEDCYPGHQMTNNLDSEHIYWSSYTNLNPTWGFCFPIELWYEINE